jgi:hypothetical protein
MEIYWSESWKAGQGEQPKLVSGTACMAPTLNLQILGVRAIRKGAFQGDLEIKRPLTT